MPNVHIQICPICGGQEWKKHLTVQDHSTSKESFDLQKCMSCTFVITQDHPDGESIGPYYASEDYISHTDTQKGLINRLYHGIRTYMLDKKKDWVEKHTTKKPGNILDIGCGTGYFLSHMVQNGWTGQGLEPDDSARKIAIDKFGLTANNSAHLFNIKEKFDAITLWHVLEHVHQLNDYFDQFNRLLNDDGLLLIAVPNYTSKDAEKYKDYWAAYDVPIHLWHFSPAAMEKLLDKHGFILQKKYGMMFDPFYVSMLSEKYKGNALGLIRGGIAGLSSNMKASANVDRSSSVVYIAKKKS